MDLSSKKIGFAMTGSFCTFSEVLVQLKALKNTGADIFPVMSKIASSTDTRFGKSSDFKKEIEEITKKKIVLEIEEAEKFGPKEKLDLMVIAPCTGNTLSKIANGICDSAVTMSAKATLRNQKPVLLAIASNDALSLGAKNIGSLLNTKNIFFVPFGQDDFQKKPTSIIAKMDLIIPSVESAIEFKQIQPILM